MDCAICGTTLDPNRYAASCECSPGKCWCTSCMYEHECGVEPCKVGPDDLLWLND